MEEVVTYGIITLLPPIAIIVFAVITRRVFEALLLGAVLGFIISDGIGFFGPFLDALYEVMEGNAWMWMTLGLFGSFVVLLTKSKGSLGFARLILKYSKTPKKSLLLTWFVSLLIFMDDYLNILTLSSAMRPVADKQKVSREMFSYVVDSTSAPVCVIIPLSTWAVFYGSVFASQPEIEHMGNAFEIYLGSMPFIFYGWVAVLLVPLVIIGVVPLMFGMKKANQRVKDTGMVYSELSSKLNKDGEMDLDKESGNALNFLLPLALLAVLTIMTEDLLIGLFAALALQFVMYLSTKAVKFGEFFDDLADGFASMIPMLFIILGALTVRISMETIGLPQFIINAVLPYMNAPLFPAITFIIVACLAFITGSNWGIPAATVPIIVPLAALGGANIFMTLGAIVSGGTFGSHACFYSDATVLTSKGCGIDNLEHAFSQIPYATIAAIIAVVLYAVFGIALT